MAQLITSPLNRPEAHCWLCVDPSKPGNHTGLATFTVGALTWCDLHEGDRAYPVGRYVSAVLIELPEVYPGARSEDPNDLIQVARAVGQWEQVYTGFAVPVFHVHPKSWKAQVPKPIHNARVMTALYESEQTLIPSLPKTKLHNVLDAIGLGLWLHGRIGRGGLRTG